MVHFSPIIKVVQFIPKCKIHMYITEQFMPDQLIYISEKFMGKLGICTARKGCIIIH